MVETMKTVSIILLLQALHIKATPLNHRLDYLDPILYQEHHQSPNGRYKYGYESHSAIAHQEHGLDGTAKGFYSYVDNQGKIHKVEYIAGHDGYKVLGDSPASIYTPEVEAARNAHLAAYNRAKAVGNNAAMKAQKDLILENQRAAYNKQLQAAQVNLGASILPTPTVHHYEKIWPLPPVRYRDLAIEVNGENRYDPRAQNRNNFGLIHSPSTVISASGSVPAIFSDITSGLYYPKLSRATRTNSGIGHNAMMMSKSQVDPLLVAQKAFENALNEFKAKYNLS